MQYHELIESKPDVLYGKPVIKGTRIAVDLITEKLSLGESIDDLLAAYPHLRAIHIYACLAYATAVLRSEEVRYLKAS